MAPSTWTSPTRSRRVRASRTAGRLSTREPSRWRSPARGPPLRGLPKDEQRASQRADVLRACDLRRHRGHLQGPDDPSYPADVRHECHPRNHPRRRDCDRSGRKHSGQHRDWTGRGDPRDHKRGWRIRSDRSHARDVQRPPGLEDPTTQMNIVITLAYLVAAVLFILGLKQLSSPKGARNGNFTAAAGMVIALLATLPLLRFTTAGVTIILVGVVIGAVVGVVGARRVKMTAIPQMVALFNGVGGGAAALVAVAELLRF